MPRINIQQCQPDAYSAMFGLEEYLSNSTIEKSLQEIIRIRALLINACQHCTGLHSDTANSLGVSKEKITAINDWHHSRLFNQQEKVA